MWLAGVEFSVGERLAAMLLHLGCGLDCGAPRSARNFSYYSSVQAAYEGTVESFVMWPCRTCWSIQVVLPN